MLDIGGMKYMCRRRDDKSPCDRGSSAMAKRQWNIGGGSSSRALATVTSGDVKEAAAV
jgi:hypothetical protein